MMLGLNMDGHMLGKNLTSWTLSPALECQFNDYFYVVSEHLKFFYALLLMLLMLWPRIVHMF